MIISIWNKPTVQQIARSVSNTHLWLSELLYGERSGSVTVAVLLWCRWLKKWSISFTVTQWIVTRWPCWRLLTMLSRTVRTTIASIIDSFCTTSSGRGSFSTLISRLVYSVCLCWSELNCWGFQNNILHACLCWYISYLCKKILLPFSTFNYCHRYASVKTTVFFT